MELGHNKSQKFNLELDMYQDICILHELQIA